MALHECAAPRRPASADRRVDQADGGFTLVELLLVITILGILSAVVVFAVGGIGDKGQGAACKTDYTTTQTAEEAYFAKAGGYATMAQLVNGNGTTVTGPLLQSASRWYDVTVGAGATTYTLGAIGTTCPANPLA